MTVETLNKQAQEAARYFEAKLNFEIGPIGLDYAFKNNEPVQVVDLRTPELYAQAHVPGAINISFDELQNTTKLDQNKTIVVYCYNITCHLSAKAALLLAQKGYKVKELLGGYQSWQEAGLQGEQVEASSCATTKSSCC